MYRFSMTIGDWSHDGHERCEDFIVESKKPVEAVRDAHFNIPAVTGINIEHLDQIDPQSFSFDGVPVENMGCVGYNII